MLERIIQLDKQVLVYLNGLGSEQWDWLWLIITKQLNWAPVFILVFYLLQKKNRLEKFWLLRSFYSRDGADLRPNCQSFQIQF